MPEIKVRVGRRDLSVVYEEGKDGFIEVRDNKKDMALFIREEGKQLLALHFIEGHEDPESQIDLDTGDVYLD
jgi:hypothetical protein